MQNKTKKLLAAALAVVLLLIVLLLLWSRRPQGEVTSFTPEFEEAQVRESVDTQDEQGIKIPGYSTIVVNANTTAASVDLQNPEGNQVYFQITFLLGEEQEPIYQSKLIEPGQHLYEITLDRALEPGDYDLTIQYSTFAMDDSYTPQNSASVNCRLQAV